MIFNKNNNGILELYECTGIIEQNIEFKELVSDVDFATFEIKKIIGAELYDSAEKNYHDGADEQLIRLVQTPIAYLSIASYFGTNTLSHGASGRKVTIDGENEKMAWEWMHERDDREIIRKAYLAIDLLIDYLNRTENPLWQNSPLRKSLEGLLVGNIEEFEQVFPIDGSLKFFFMLVPFMAEAQRYEIKPILKDKYSNLLTDSNLSSVLSLCKSTIPLLAICIAVRRLSLTVIPKGVVQQFTSERLTQSASVVPSETALSNFVANLRREADLKLDKIKHLLYTLSNDNADSYIMPLNDPNNKFART